MRLLDILKNENIKVTELPKQGNQLRKQWEDSFAKHLSLEEKKDIHLYDSIDGCGYLWHLFSYEKRGCMQGDAAEQAFDSKDKRTCYIFYQHTDDAFIIEEAEALTSMDLLEESDVYITDREFSWTYVKTHETGWFGPYFCQKD